MIIKINCYYIEVYWLFYGKEFEFEDELFIFF